jgi:hypothetical protein
MEYIFSLERYPSSVIGVLEALLKLEQINTVVSWAWTCKTILEICTKECKDRLFTLLTLDPSNTTLVLYKNYIQKWYHYKKSPIPLRWIVSSLLRCPVEKKIQWVILPPRKFIVNNITLSCPERPTLWLYKTSTNQLVSQTLDVHHTLILCEPLDSISLSYIWVNFSSLTKLKLIRATLKGKLFNQNISLSNLVTLWIIECDLTYCNLNSWTSSLKKLQKLKLENNKWDPKINLWHSKIVDLTSSITSVSITHTNLETLFINTRGCGKNVTIK